jgi:hypothetical protein
MKSLLLILILCFAVAPRAAEVADQKIVELKPIIYDAKVLKQSEWNLLLKISPTYKIYDFSSISFYVSPETDYIANKFSKIPIKYITQKDTPSYIQFRIEGLNPQNHKMLSIVISCFNEDARGNLRIEPIENTNKVLSFRINIAALADSKRFEKIKNYFSPPVNSVERALLMGLRELEKIYLNK